MNASAAQPTPRGRRTRRPVAEQIHAPNAIDLCSLLASPTRWQILVELGHGPLTVGDLARRLGIETTVTSTNLARLYDHELVNILVDGRYRIYSLGEGVSCKKRGKKVTISLNAPDHSSVTVKVPV